MICDSKERVGIDIVSLVCLLLSYLKTFSMFVFLCLFPRFGFEFSLFKIRGVTTMLVVGDYDGVGSV